MIPALLDLASNHGVLTTYYNKDCDVVTLDLYINHAESRRKRPFEISFFETRFKINKVNVP